MRWCVFFPLTCPFRQPFCAEAISTNCLCSNPFCAIDFCCHRWQRSNEEKLTFNRRKCHAGPNRHSDSRQKIKWKGKHAYRTLFFCWLLPYSYCLTRVIRFEWPQIARVYIIYSETCVHLNLHATLLLPNGRRPPESSVISLSFSLSLTFYSSFVRRQPRRFCIHGSSTHLPTV